jgi:hypothetical protein
VSCFDDRANPRPRIVVLAVAIAAAGCGRAPDATARLGEGPAPADTGPAAVARAVDAGLPPAPVATDAGARPPASAAKLSGRVVPLGAAPRARVMVVRAGETRGEPLWSALADREGRFVTTELPPGTYRIVLPGDGVHSTADLYATVGDGDAGRDELVIHRSKGCPIVVAVTGPDDQGVASAALEVELPDLEQVGDARARIRATTGDDGTAEIAGSCVRGPIRVRVTVPGTAEPFEARRGTMGNGRDRVVIAVPGHDAGPGPAPDRAEDTP